MACWNSWKQILKILLWTLSMSCRTGLDWNIRNFSRTVHGSLGTRSSGCAQGWKPHLCPTQPNCPYCHILPSCLDGVWINQPALGWGICVTFSVPLEERNRSHWQIQAQKQVPRGESCRQGWGKPFLHVLPCICLQQEELKELCEMGHTPEIIARIYSLFPWLATSHRKKKKNKHRGGKLHISSRSSKIFFLLLGMKEMIRGKMSSFLSSAATICKPSSNIFEIKD